MLRGVMELLSGIGAVFEPISIETTQDVVHAIESFSLILASAPREDTYSFTQQYLPTFLYSLLALESELVGYTAVVRGVLSSQRRYMSHYMNQKHMVGSYIPVSVQTLSIAIDEALNRLCRGYYDVILRYPFPQPYEQALIRRLKAFDVKTRK